jgi:hypothetical protein
MILLNLFFLVLSTHIALQWIEDDSTHWIGWLNLFAAVLNLFPVVNKLLQ